MTVVVFLGAGLIVLVLVVLAGNRMLRGGAGSTGMTDGLGTFIDVFDPARARSDRDLKEMESKTEVAPSPDGDDLPVQVDLGKGTARIRRTTEPGH